MEIKEQKNNWTGNKNKMKENVILNWVSAVQGILSNFRFFVSLFWIKRQGAQNIDRRAQHTKTVVGLSDKDVGVKNVFFFRDFWFGCGFVYAICSNRYRNMASSNR